MPQKLTVLDLFSGIGGFSLGLERTGGFRTIAFCEIDPYCQRVLRKHWPDVPIHSDIRSLTAGQFERRPDLLCGGFPCQDISVAGKQAGLTGERSGLWFEMLRVIRELRPTWLLIENVPNLRTKGADIVFAGLEEAGYAWTSAVVGAWAVGAPHKRNRVWILGNAKHDGSFAAEVAGSIGETVCDDTQGTNSTEQSKEQVHPQCWPTPRASKIGGYASPGYSPTLEQAVNSFPTPAARDWKDNGKSPAELARNSKTLATIAGGSLNPTWVEWLMGFPTEYTVLEPSATPSFRKSPNSLDDSSSK